MNASELRKYIEESLREVRSAPIEEMDRARKSTGQYQDWHIKTKEMMWSYFDEELGALDSRNADSLSKKKSSDALVDKVFNVIVSAIPGEVPDSVKRIRKSEEEKRGTADMEKMGIYNLDNPNIPVKVHTRLPNAKLKKKSRWRLRETNTMKLTTESLKQMIKEELGMDQQGEGGAPEENVAIENLTAAVDSLVQNLGYGIEEVLEIVQGLGESSGVSTAMDGDQVVTMREGGEEELEECGSNPMSQEDEAPTRRYFKIR